MALPPPWTSGSIIHPVTATTGHTALAQQCCAAELASEKHHHRPALPTSVSTEALRPTAKWGLCTKHSDPALVPLRRRAFAP